MGCSVSKRDGHRPTNKSFVASEKVNDNREHKTDKISSHKNQEPTYTDPNYEVNRPPPTDIYSNGNPDPVPAVAAAGPSPADPAPKSSSNLYASDEMRGTEFQSYKRTPCPVIEGISLSPMPDFSPEAEGVTGNRINVKRIQEMENQSS